MSQEGAFRYISDAFRVSGLIFNPRNALPPPPLLPPPPTRTTIFSPGPAPYTCALGEKFPVWAPSIRPAKSAHYFPPSESEGGEVGGQIWPGGPSYARPGRTKIPSV